MIRRVKHDHGYTETVAVTPTGCTQAESESSEDDLAGDTIALQGLRLKGTRIRREWRAGGRDLRQGREGWRLWLSGYYC